MAAPIKRPFGLLAVLALALVLILPALLGLPTAAQVSESLGVSPAEVRVADAQEGESYQRKVTIQNARDSPTVFTLDLRGDTADWTTATPTNTLQVPARSEGSVTLRFDVPEDAYIGKHTGQLAVTADPGDQPEGSGLATAWGVTVLLNVTVGGEGTKELTWSDPRVPDIETGTPPTALVDVVNSGNMLTTAKITAETLSFSDDEVLASAETERAVIPGQQETLELPFEDALPEGQYRMRFTSQTPTPYEAVVEFKVVPPGALGKEGLLRYIEHEPWVQTGEVVRLTAVFENTGTAAIARAVFTAEIEKDGRLVGVVESDPRVVQVGQRSELVAYYTPERPGEHIVTGRVGYDGYQTLESESVLNVEGSAASDQSWLLIVPVLLLAAALIALLIVRRRTRAPTDRRGSPERTRHAHPRNAHTQRMGGTGRTTTLNRRR